VTTDVGALANDWATDPAVLARVLNRLRQWGDPDGPPPLAQPQRTVGHPEFGVTCRRASPTDLPADITLPATLPSSNRPPVCLPPTASPTVGRSTEKRVVPWVSTG
jgi:hypothetical protein